MQRARKYSDFLILRSPLAWLAPPSDLTNDFPCKFGVLGVWDPSNPLRAAILRHAAQSLPKTDPYVSENTPVSCSWGSRKSIQFFKFRILDPEVHTIFDILVTSSVWPFGRACGASEPSKKGDPQFYKLWGAKIK